MKLPATLDPCDEAAAWLDTQPDPQTAWQTCPRSSWMLWVLDELGYHDERVLRLFACWCARETPLPDGRKSWDLLVDPRSRSAVELAERFAVGAASPEDLALAESSARSARSAASSAAWSVTESAARTAARSAPWSAAWFAAWAAAESAQAAQLRKMVPYSVVERLLASIIEDR